jgi:hypothetical protein
MTENQDIRLTNLAAKASIDVWNHKFILLTKFGLLIFFKK